MTGHLFIQNTVASSGVPAGLLPEPCVSVVRDGLMSDQNHARDNASN